LLIELILQVRGALVDIREATQLSRGKFSDKQFGESFYRLIAKETGTSDLLLSSLLNYLKIGTPVDKTNTVRNLIERVLTKYRAQLENKNIKVTEIFEENLPETIVPDEQLEYILNSVLLFAVVSAPPHGSVEFSTNSFRFQRDAAGVQSFLGMVGRHIEIQVVFSNGVKTAGRSGIAIGGIRSPQKDEEFDLLLRLAREVVERNRGMMRFQTDEQKRKITISLIFPVERRRASFYKPN
jgi:hypothetical protein